MRIPLAHPARTRRPASRRGGRILAAVLVVLAVPFLLSLGFTLLPGGASYAVLSDSMAPTFERGALVYTYDTGRYEPGDVITYEHDGAIVTHRIVETTGLGYVTKGDANARPDAGPVPRERVRGEVLFSIPLYGRFPAILSGRVGSLALVAAGLTAVGLSVRTLLAHSR